MQTSSKGSARAGFYWITAVPMWWVVADVEISIEEHSICW